MLGKDRCGQLLGLHLNRNDQAPRLIGSRDRRDHHCDGSCLRRCLCGRQKRVALIVGNSSYQTVPQLPNPSRDANVDRKDVPRRRLRIRRRPAQRRQPRVQAGDPQVRDDGRPGRHRGGLLCRPRPRNRRNQLSHSDRCQAGQRPRCATTRRFCWSGWCRRRTAPSGCVSSFSMPAATIPSSARCAASARSASRAVAAGLGKVEPTSTDTLIAYAAKAGSTADDGDGLHSPFTTAVLKNLTVPGLDVRLAFGRVRDEVMKTTSNRQEPFVYGSLGGGNIALVPAPVRQPESAVSDIDIKTDYELVQKIGSPRAWEVFLGTHPTGFYADLARAQLEGARSSRPAESTAPANVNLASLPQPARPPEREASSKEGARVGQGQGQRRSRGACRDSSSASRIRRCRSPPSSGWTSSRRRLGSARNRPVPSARRPARPRRKRCARPNSARPNRRRRRNAKTRNAAPRRRKPNKRPGLSKPSARLRKQNRRPSKRSGTRQTRKPPPCAPPATSRREKPRPSARRQSSPPRRKSPAKRSKAG